MYNNPILELQNNLRNNGNNQQQQIPNQINQQVIQQVKMLFNQAKMAQNPITFLNQLIMSNPQAAQAFEYIRQNGGDPKTAFYNYAKQLGIDDPQTVLNTLQS